jgi:hypothetical protein
MRKHEKSQILDQVCEVTGHTREYALTLLTTRHWTGCISSEHAVAAQALREQGTARSLTAPGASLGCTVMTRSRHWHLRTGTIDTDWANRYRHVHCASGASFPLQRVA